MSRFRSSGDHVSCPVCGWTCLHHGSRSDGLAVSWRVPADQSSSGNVRDRAFVKQFAYMRAHVRDHALSAETSPADIASARLAMSFIPTRHRKIIGGTVEQRQAERRKRYRSKQIDTSRLRRKRLRVGREEEKIRQVPTLTLREDLRRRGFEPTCVPAPGRDVRASVTPLYLADQPSPRTFEDRCAEALLDRDGVRLFCSRVEPIVTARGSDVEVLRDARDQLSSFYDFGSDVSLHALRKAVSCAKRMVSAWERDARSASWLSPSQPVLDWPRGPLSEDDRTKAWRAHDKIFKKASSAAQGDGCHHLTLESQNRVIEAVTKRRRSRRRVLETGYGLGYLVAGLAATGADVVGIELSRNSGTVKSTMKEADNVLVFDADANHLTAELLDHGRFTSLTCLIGLTELTLHVAEIFLDSWYCTELAYLLPAKGAKLVRERLEDGNVSLEQFQVTLAGGNGRRSVVVATKRDLLSFA